LDEIEKSKFGIGLEKLERNLFDSNKTYLKFLKIVFKNARKRIIL
jgi:hypothetical protein